MALLYILGSVIIVSLVALITIIPLIIKKKVPETVLRALLGISAGTLLGAAFIHLLPEAISGTYTLGLAIYVLSGILAFFLLEKIIHHNHKGNLKRGHSHAYHLAPVNLIGDGIHNFIDGLVIAGSYLVSIPLGIATTISVALHEVPQEIADFGILLYAGFSKKKAIFFNFLSAATAVIGGIIGFALHNVSDKFIEFIIPFTAGVFIYIGASNLIPELHKTNSVREMIIQAFSIIAGIVIMILITLNTAHVH